MARARVLLVAIVILSVVAVLYKTKGECEVPRGRGLTFIPSANDVDSRCRFSSTCTRPPQAERMRGWINTALFWPTFCIPAGYDATAVSQIADGFYIQLAKVIRNAYLAGDFSLADMEKIDFSIPGTTQYRADSKMTFFSPNSLFRNKDGIGIADQNALKELRKDRKSEIIFNVRRYLSDDGSKIDTLYAIVPDVDPEYCTELFNLKASFDIHLAPDNHKVILDPGPILEPSTGPTACILTQDHKHAHLFENIMRRGMKSGEKQWRAM